jgi:ABC-type xylose transport system permease subunit
MAVHAMHVSGSQRDAPLHANVELYGCMTSSEIASWLNNLIATLAFVAACYAIFRDNRRSKQQQLSAIRAEQNKIDAFTATCVHTLERAVSIFEEMSAVVRSEGLDGLMFPATYGPILVND